MRLWSLHPKYLDTKGLNGLWVESLLAQKVLLGLTKGYTKHPQLNRFRATGQPLDAMSSYLQHVWWESYDRGFNYNKNKIRDGFYEKYIVVNDEQLEYERDFLLFKLRKRKSDKYLILKETVEPEVHPMFFVVGGPIEPWEKVKEFEL